MLKLHYAPGTISVAVAIALEEAGLAYEPVKVDFASAEQTAAPYLALNPKGRVPTLVTEAGTTLTARPRRGWSLPTLRPRPICAG